MGMALLSPTRHPLEMLLVIALAILQVLESKVWFLASPRGNLFSILLKLAVGWILMGFTGGLQSSYYLILLVPVVSAATSFRALGTSLVTLLACASYVSFLLFIDWTRYEIDADQQRELILRLLFLSVTGYLTHTLAEANREQSRKYKDLAEQLAAANRSLGEAEATVRRSDRLVALGQLSAGLAHELRNPLGTIKASADVLSRSLANENQVARELAGFISSEVDRTNSLVTRFLEFARPLQLRLAQTELASVLDRAISQLGNGSVYKNYSPEIPPFPLDAELMELVIYNLLANATQASAPGAAITVKTRPVENTAEISIIDRGSGIESKHLESIFNPFFTTKPEGVGLGLAIVSKIVDEHGGRMAVESEPGKGSIFRVYLPLRPKG